MVEIFQAYGEGDHYRSLDLFARWQFVFGRHRWLRIRLQRWERLIVALEVDRGNCIATCLSARCYKLSLNVMHPERFLAGISQRESEGNQRAFCPGSSTAVTVSSDPAPCGLARWKNDMTATMMSITAPISNSGFAGGRLRLAVPNSSAMLIVGPHCGLAAAASAGALSAGGGAGAGLGDSSGMAWFALLDCTPSLGIQFH